MVVFRSLCSLLVRPFSSMSLPNRLRFDLSSPEIALRTDALIQRSTQVMDLVASIPESERTFSSVILPLAWDEGEFETESSNLTFLSYVSADKEIRDASTEANKKLEEFGIESAMRIDLFEAVRTVSERVEHGAEKLEPNEKRILDDMMLDFKRNGLHLALEERNSIKEIQKQISEMSIEFQRNLAEDSTSFWVTREELRGLPDDFIQSLAAGKDENEGKYQLTLKYPHLFPVLRKCAHEPTRMKMDELNGKKCMEQNVPILEKVTLLRQELAEKLGYSSHAQYILEKRMAKNPSVVMSFLNELLEKLSSRASSELDNLLSLKQSSCSENGNDFDGKIHGWDMQFYHTKLLEEAYNVDQDKIKEYFPADRVVAQILSLYEMLLSLRFEELSVDERHVWHNDVRQFSVYDKQSDDFIGHFYLDLYPRDGKFTHAAAFPLQIGYVKEDGTYQNPAAAMVCNFTPPSGSQPSLLKHDEVVTWCHEMGHIMHSLVSTARWARFFGTRVQRDFVETPSQMMENWCWDAEFLESVSGHFLDESKKIPREFVDALIAAKNVDAGLLYRRQLFFGLFDMMVHHEHFSENGSHAGVPNTEELWSRMRKEITLIEHTPGTNGAGSFAHIISGYSAGYYGYLWSEVFAKDLFAHFKASGIMNASVGFEYRQKILSQGNMQDAGDLLRDFLGREPSNEAFLAELGISI